MNVIGLDTEYTERATGKIQRAAVLQLCLEDDVLVYHIIHSPSIPGELHNFLSREDVYFCGAAIEGDKQKLEPYNLDLKSIADLQTRIKIPVEDCDKQTPSLFDVANFVLGTNIQKGDETVVKVVWMGELSLDVRADKICCPRCPCEFRDSCKVQRACCEAVSQRK